MIFGPGDVIDIAGDVSRNVAAPRPLQRASNAGSISMQ